MQENDTFIISIKKAPNSAFMKAFEKDWLGYLGFSKKELNTNVKLEEWHYLLFFNQFMIEIKESVWND